MGVYQIRNTTNGKIFIGSAKNVHGKLNSHKFQLVTGLHIIKEMQNDFRDVGEAGFTFEVLDFLKPKDEVDYDYTEELMILENMWLEKLNPYGDNGYNSRK